LFVILEISPTLAYCKITSWSCSRNSAQRWPYTLQTHNGWWCNNSRRAILLHCDDLWMNWFKYANIWCTFYCILAWLRRRR